MTGHEVATVGYDPGTGEWVAVCTCGVERRGPGDEYVVAVERLEADHINLEGQR